MTSPTHDLPALDAPGAALMSADDPRLGIVVPKQSVGLPDLDEWRKLEAYAVKFANSGLVKSRELRGNADACLIVILKGRELRLPPAEAIHSIFIIEGVPTLRASTMQAVIQREGHRMWPGPCDDDRAVVLAQRLERDGSYSDIVEVAWTYAEAQRAKLVTKDNWRNYPGDMLFARAVSRTGRRVFADVLMGCVYVPEELGATEVNGTIVVPEARRAGRGVGYSAPAIEGERVNGTDDPATAEAEPEPEAIPPFDDLMREFHEIAGLLGKKPSQLAARWIAAHKKNVEDASPQELHDLVKSLRPLIADLPRPPRDDAPEQAGGETAEAPADAPDEDAAEAPPAPHAFVYNDEGDNDACDAPGCGLAVDADVHTTPPADGQAPLI